MRKLVTLVVFPWLFMIGASVGGLTGASADTGGSVTTGDGTIDSRAGRHDRTSGGGAPSPPLCTYRLLPFPPSNPMWYRDRHNIPVDDGTGAWFAKWCGTNFYGVVYISRTDPTELLAAARRRLTLPLPAPQMSPSGEQLVNVPTWLWVDTTAWRELTSTVSVPGVTVSVTARPVGSVWSMGDGTRLTCTGAGIPFDPARDDPASSSSCSHTYRRSSAAEPDQRFRGSVTVEWQAAWSVTGAPGGGTLGTLTRTTGFSAAVAEVEALNRTAAGT